MRITERWQVDYDTLVFEEHDAVHLRAVGDPSLLKWLSDKFALQMPDWKFSPAARYGNWKGWTHFITPDGLVPIPLLQRVVEAMDIAGYKWLADFRGSQFFDPMATMEAVKSFADTVLEGTEYRLRDYQLFSLWKMLQRKRGIIEVSVGGGKSIISYVFVRAMMHMGLRVLMIVPTITLVNQLRADFLDYGWVDVDQHAVFIGGKNLMARGPMGCPLVVSTYQSCGKFGIEWFRAFGSLVMDEAHGAKSESMRLIGESCTNAYYRIGMTGTMPESEFDVRRVECLLGDTIATVTSAELIELGVLSPVEIITVYAHHPTKLRPFEVRDYHIETDYIETCAYRRDFLCRVINTKISMTENVLILVKSIEQIEKLTDEIKEKCPGRKVFRFYGKTKADEREGIRQGIEDMEGVIVVATFKTFSTGVNVPKLHHLFLASTSKAKIAVIQSAGRVLRRHKTKTLAMVWDFVDVFPWDVWALHALISEQDKEKQHSFSVLHHRKRKRYFQKAGFPIREFDVPMVA